MLNREGSRNEQNNLDRRIELYGWMQEYFYIKST
jgi:hypothetical protein